MRCHVCNAEVGDHQRFCHECGESLSGVTDPTEALDMQTVFDAADAEGGTVAGSLHWSDTDDESTDDELTDDESTEDDVPDAASTMAGAVPDASDDESTEDGLPPTMAVGLGVAGGADDIWATPTGEQAAAVAPVAATATEQATPLDPAATTALAEQPVTSAAEATSAVPAAEATTAMSAVPPPPPVASQATDELGSVAAGATDTDQMAPVFDAAADPDRFPLEKEPFRFRLTLVAAVLAVLTAVLATLADVTDVRTDRVVPGIDNRLRTLDDIGSNLSVAAFIGAGVLLIGGVLHCFNLRWGAGLAGGAGLALAGWSAVTIGLAEVPISVAERITRDPNTPGPFVLTVTRDLGYWLILALGVLGLLAFLLSLVSAGAGGRAGLDPWTAAVGALGGVVAAAGPLVPVANATFSSNFGVNDLPTAFFAGRLVQVALLGGSVMVGFLLVRRYGLGLAAGGLSIPTFMWLTTLIDVGSSPIGIAVGNLGTADITPHAVTTAGMVVALFMLVVASTLAAVRRQS